MPNAIWYDPHSILSLDAVYSLLALAASGTYVYLAARHVYEQRRLRTAVEAAIAALGLIFVITVHRFVLFFITFTVT